MLSSSSSRLFLLLGLLLMSMVVVITAEAEEPEEPKELKFLLGFRLDGATSDLFDASPLGLSRLLSTSCNTSSSNASAALPYYVVDPTPTTTALRLWWPILNATRFLAAFAPYTTAPTVNHTARFRIISEPSLCKTAQWESCKDQYATKALAVPAGRVLSGFLVDVTVTLDPPISSSSPLSVTPHLASFVVSFSLITVNVTLPTMFSFQLDWRVRRATAPPLPIGWGDAAIFYGAIGGAVAIGLVCLACAMCRRSCPRTSGSTSDSSGTSQEAGSQGLNLNTMRSDDL